LLNSLRAARANPPFIFSMAVYLLTWVAVSMVEANLLLFVTYVVRRSDDSNLIMASVFVVAILVLPFWEWASRNMNKRLAYIIGIAFWAVVQIVLVMLGPATPLWAILVLAALAGIGVSAAHVIPWAIIPDAIEWDELQTGERHEGIFYSLVTLLKKVATAVALFLGLKLLGWSGYIPEGVNQPAGTVRIIRILTGPIPAFFLCAGIVFALLYPLTRERHAEVRREIAQRKAAQSEENV
jgi:GPH family glycoside/pentoside/hexuronide:cation symporter